ncbi:MAG TPA: hypothetical protein VK638_24285 [Edaphobacter sp.]|nr:hypothetical protein [Edaphobacter sp.]
MAQRIQGTDWNVRPGFAEADHRIRFWNSSRSFSASSTDGLSVLGQYIQTTSQTGLPSNATYADKTQFAPRIGLTYSINDKTVIRGGFGTFYEPEGTSGRVNLNTLPFRLSETVAQTQYVNNPRILADYFARIETRLCNSESNTCSEKGAVDRGTNIHYSLNIQRQFSNNDVLEVG